MTEWSEDEQKLDVLIDLMAALGRIEMKALSLRLAIEQDADRMYREWVSKQDELEQSEAA